MSSTLSESTIVRAVADRAGRHITRQVIAAFQRMPETLAGDDSGLKSTWDAICAQVQYEESIFWDAYDETVRAMVAGYLAKLPELERAALWLQTGAGSNWESKDEADREPDSVVNDDIVNHVTTEYVYLEAGRWSNARIRAYIERSCRSD